MCYLNSQGPGEEQFEGGTFHFEGGPSVAPEAGRVLAYWADERNVHRIDRVTRGRRHTLQLWFTDEVGAATFSEDRKLLLDRFPCGLAPSSTFLPDELYKLESGEDMRELKVRRLEAATATLVFARAEEAEGAGVQLGWRGGRVACSTMDEALQLAVLCSKSAAALRGTTIEDLFRALRRHEELASLEMRKAWQRSEEVGELYLPDDVHYGGLLPSMIQ